MAPVGRSGGENKEKRKLGDTTVKSFSETASLGTDGRHRSLVKQGRTSTTSWPGSTQRSSQGKDSYVGERESRNDTGAGSRVNTLRTIACEFRAPQFKKGFFRYKAKIGHFPKEAESFAFVKRTDPKTKVTKVIPEVVYPIMANRSVVPKHAMLEDDWRAYRSVLHNYQTFVRMQADPQAQLLDSLKCMLVASRIYKSLGCLRYMPQVLFAPTLAMYRDSMDTPLGYMYREYRESCEAGSNSQKLEMGRQQLEVPVVMFEGPHTDMVHVPHGKRVKAAWQQDMDCYDADAILTSTSKPAMFIYNEPEAIPQSCARLDFSQSLPERALTAATNITDDANKPLIPPVPENSACYDPAGIPGLNFQHPIAQGTATVCYELEGVPEVCAS